MKSIGLSVLQCLLIILAISPLAAGLSSLFYYHTLGPDPIFAITQIIFAGISVVFPIWLFVLRLRGEPSRWTIFVLALLLGIWVLIVSGVIFILAALGNGAL